jgi:hypothetical protein
MVKGKLTHFLDLNEVLTAYGKDKSDLFFSRPGDGVHSASTPLVLMGTSSRSKGTVYFILQQRKP